MSLMEKAMLQPLVHFSFPVPHSVQLKPFSICCASVSSNSSPSPAVTVISAPPVLKKRKRYRKEYPGESQGITEEMRFVAMRLRNINGKKYPDPKNQSGNGDAQESPGSEVEEEGDDENGGQGDTWYPSMEGFLKYLVDSKLVFSTVERIIDETSDVAYAYFRKTGLERSENLSKDLEWFSQQDIMIPEPSTPGVSYAKYLEELAEKSAPLFLSHFYNIYFSHIAGGQVIAKKVSEKLLKGRELEFNSWEGDVPELLKGVRDKLNMLGEHWSRDDKNKCLREATKSFRFMGQIVRLIIL
ncbi:Heme oxygenase 1 protein [Quillaja saponaria]|uniref:Heme oxygenase 1 protein n=1 Tax=Quillaja saponaria TaxID=32244 RepID=A0AAD7LYK1_QUISA|nr:Heme oxygenase 1 protein [Quillaja saponaria]